MPKANRSLDERFDQVPAELLPEVELLNRQQLQKQRLASLSPKQRRQRQADQEKSRRRAPGRATYDISPALKKRIQQLADEENRRVPASQLVMLALVRFVQDYAEGNIDLAPLLNISHSPRFDFVLDTQRILSPIQSEADTPAGGGTPSEVLRIQRRAKKKKDRSGNLR